MEQLHLYIAGQYKKIDFMRNRHRCLKTALAIIGLCILSLFIAIAGCGSAINVTSDSFITRSPATQITTPKFSVTTEYSTVVNAKTPQPSSGSSSTYTSTINNFETITPTLAFENLSADATTAAAFIPTIIAGGTSNSTSFVSPDKEWTVEIISYACTSSDGTLPSSSYEALLLKQRKRMHEIIVTDQLLLCEGLGAAGIGGISWSSNSRYFYFTTARQGIPDGLCGYWQRPANRFDVIEQRVENLGGAHFSPTGKSFLVWQDRLLAVWHLEDTHPSEHITPLILDALPGQVAWSPDEKSFVYLQTENDCYPFGQTFLVLVDLETLHQTLILASNQPSLRDVQWSDPASLTLFDENDGRWNYDFLTTKLVSDP